MPRYNHLEYYLLGEIYVALPSMLKTTLWLRKEHVDKNIIGVGDVKHILKTEPHTNCKM